MKLILIAEDNWLAAAELEQRMAAEGRRVVVAPATAAALAAAEAERPALAIVDLQLEAGMDGAGLAAALTVRDVPVLVYTGFSAAAARRALGDVPVVDVLVKPLSSEQVLQAVRGILRRAAA